MCFGVDVKHFNIVGDFATHAKKETFVSVVWSWEHGYGAFGDVQQVLPGSVVLPGEDDLSDRVQQLALEFRLDRVASYRQLQATSNTLHTLTNGRTNIHSFLLPDDVHVRAPEQSEVRVVRNEAGSLGLGSVSNQNSRATQRANQCPWFSRSNQTCALIIRI